MVDYTIPKASIKRLIKEQGAERVSDEAVDVIHGNVEEYVRNVARKSFEVSKIAGRKTIKASDIEIALDSFV